jgi:hypothetical protein
MNKVWLSRRLVGSLLAILFSHPTLDVAVLSRHGLASEQKDAGRAEEREDGLSVPESVGAVLTTGGGYQWHLYKRTNPDAKPCLYRVLETEELWGSHHLAFLVLGYIGEGRDAQRMEAILLGWSGVLTRRQSDSVQGMIRGLGVMSRRRVEEATAILDRMSTVKYWREADIQIYPAHAIGPSLAPELQGIVLAAIGQSLAGRLDLEEIQRRMLAEVEDGEMRARLASFFNVAALRAYLEAMRAKEMRAPEAAERVTLRRRFQEKYSYFRDLGDFAAELPGVSSAPDPEVAISQPVPRDMLPRQAIDLVNRGDSSVIAVLRDWLDAPLPPPVPRLYRHETAAVGLGDFRDRSVLDKLRQLFDAPSSDQVLRNSAAYGLAMMATDQDAELLKQIMWHPYVLLPARCLAAGRLVEWNDDDGARHFLLLQYDLYRLESGTRGGGNMGSVRNQLESMSDPKIITSLEARVPDETHAAMKRNILTLVEAMKINGQPIETLMQFAADPAWEFASRRYTAIGALGRLGGPELIPFIETLPPWQGDNVPVGQPIVLQSAIDDAIAHIRQRYWQ